LAGQEPQFDNGLRILTLAAEVKFNSDYAEPLRDAVVKGQLAFDRAQVITTGLERHKLLEDEVKTLRATIKAIENKRDDLVESARAKITKEQARIIIIERLRVTLLNTYQNYLRAEQRACVAAIENLWQKYAVTAKTIGDQRDAAAEELQAFLVELGYNTDLSDNLAERELH
jgi:type I restriction enzyme M protein